MNSRIAAGLIIAALLITLVPVSVTSAAPSAQQVCRTKAPEERKSEKGEPEIVCVPAKVRQRPAAPARVRPPKPPEATERSRTAPTPVPTGGQVCRTKKPPEKVLQENPELKPEVVCVTPRTKQRPPAPPKTRP